MTRTRKEFQQLSVAERNVLQVAYEAQMSSDISVKCRMNADCPTTLARRVFQDRSIPATDDRVASIRDLLQKGWIILPTKESPTYSVSTDFTRFAAVGSAV